MKTVASTDAKRLFGQLVDDALMHGTVAVTRHDRPVVYLVSAAEYERLKTLDTKTVVPQRPMARGNEDDDVCRP